MDSNKNENDKLHLEVTPKEWLMIVFALGCAAGINRERDNDRGQEDSTGSARQYLALAQKLESQGHEP